MSAMSDQDQEAQNGKIRRRRNLAIAGALACLVIFFFVMTMVRIEQLYGP